MKREWMNKTLLALSVQMVMGAAYAADEPALGEYEEVVEVEETVAESVAEPELGGYEQIIETEEKIAES
ncbi:MAG: hypothetical protein ACN6NR_00055, partial [Acinetobacter schindleri]